MGGYIATVRRELVRDDYRPIVNNPEAAAVVAGDIGYAKEEREIFKAIFLDARLHVLGVEIVSMGTANATIIHPRDVFREAIRLNAVRLILMHNHPSGDTDPSTEDLEMTAKLEKGAEILGLQIVDHVIIAPNAASPRGYSLASLRQRGEMT